LGRPDFILSTYSTNGLFIQPKFNPSDYGLATCGEPTVEIILRVTDSHGTGEDSVTIINPPC
jgi:hypothetical protein